MSLLEITVADPKRLTCKANVSIPYDGENVTVCLDVEFEVCPPDPTVGIFGCGIDAFWAKVVDVDIEPTPDLAVFQAYFDAHEEEYRAEIDEECLKSLDNHY